MYDAIFGRPASFPKTSNLDVRCHNFFEDFLYFWQRGGYVSQKFPWQLPRIHIKMFRLGPRSEAGRFLDEI
jgi:hypothetical protein